MRTLVTRSAVILSVLLLVPVVASAQAAITGVVKDASGGVLPGVTVEAASPVLIEKVRSVVTDDTGQYRIVNLRPGTYSLTFSLPGFSTIKRDGIELTGTFVATVNGELKVGALEETITVTGETPIVDVQSARQQQTVSKDILAAVPTSRSAQGIQALVPGMSTASDVGGIAGNSGGGAGTIHGGRANDARTLADGLNMGWAGANSNGALANVAGAQETVLSTSGGLGEAETSGVVLNVIPRDGGNTFSGTFITSGASGGMQSNNYTSDLQAQGLKTPSQLLKVFDVNPMGGGRILRDKLWFYVTYRQWGADNTVPGMWINKNAGLPYPADRFPNFDLSQQAFSDNRQKNGVARLTWQATPRNKLTASWSEQYNATASAGGGSATTTIEATNRTLFQPSHVQQATWSSPVTGRLLLEAGFGTYLSIYQFAPRIDGTFNADAIRIVDQGTLTDGGIAGLAYNAPNQFTISQIGTHEWKASISYVTGAHSMKFGYMGGYDTPYQSYYYYNNLIALQFRNGIPNQLTETIDYPGRLKYQRNLIPADFYAQDQWTRSRLTLQGGVRYDHILTKYPDSSVGGSSLFPTVVSFPAGSTQGVHWSDITPRMGASYDLFGNGKTAIKFNLGKYMEAFSATNTDLDLNPIIRIAVSTTRSWNDTGGLGVNGDFIPQCDLTNPLANGECGPMATQTLGQANFTRSYDPNFVTGWGKRPFNWDMGVQVQQQIFPRVSVNAGYFRRWFGNQYSVENLATPAGDYTPFSITAPVDPRLPGGGGYTVGGLYNVIPADVGKVNELATNQGLVAQTENWQGVDVGVTGRLRNGLTVQGGTSTGRYLTDNCALRAAIPELGTGVTGALNNSITSNNDFAGSSTGVGSSVTNPYCRIVQPYLTQIRGLASYTLPWAGVQVSGTLQSNPGPMLAANYVVPNAAVVPSLGRSLSGGAANVTVNLIQPGSLYGARVNETDFRVAKIFKFPKQRLQLALDLYNALNAGTPLTYNSTFTQGGPWNVPTSILSARFVKLSAQFDF